MYFFYIDESGSLDATTTGQRADGSSFNKDHLYVLTAVSLFEWRWNRFDKALNGKKRELMDILRRTNPAGLPRLELADCEIKSTWIRIPKERNRRPFLANLTDPDLEQLVDLYYEQLRAHHMQVFAAVVDKRHLHGYLDSGKMHRKAWELLLERIETYLSEEHTKHQGLLITDDIGIQHNRSLAMKHAYIQMAGTAMGTRLKHIAEMPLFVRSELSNGVQLADLASYNIYRCFRDDNVDYPFFERIVPYLWVSKRTPEDCLDGICVFPPESPLTEMHAKIVKKRASLETAGPQ
jgi:Protein of unknown function (DUF3800)